MSNGCFIEVKKVGLIKYSNFALSKNERTICYAPCMRRKADDVI
jgi:hypothetical protein